VDNTPPISTMTPDARVKSGVHEGSVAGATRIAPLHAAEIVWASNDDHFRSHTSAADRQPGQLLIVTQRTAVHVRRSHQRRQRRGPHQQRQPQRPVPFHFP
jgi:hypothetical protein